MSTLATITLDDRSFQDLVDEAKKLIPHYIPEWSDHNVSDPGVTLIELFAWMTETILYRLNRVPLLHAVRMMEILGIALAPPEPAQGEVTFWLSADLAPVETSIPIGTEVATTQTENEPSTIFTTMEELQVIPPKLTVVASRIAAPNASSNEKQIARFELFSLLAQKQKELNDENAKEIPLFSLKPVAKDAFYLGFETDLSRHLLQLDMRITIPEGAGVNERFPPYRFQAYSNETERWVDCPVDTDTTGALTKSGTIRLHLPPMMAQLNEQISAEQPLYWVRILLDELTPQQLKAGYQPYAKSPEIRKLMVSTHGGTVPITHGRVIRSEFIGRSDGSAGQRFFLQSTPILKREPDTEYLEVIAPNTVTGAAITEHWQEVPDFADSWDEENQRGRKHYVIDSLSGELRFGPAVHQPNGKIKLYGAIPARNATLRFVQYRTGGGIDGNVQPNKINTLKTALPYVDRVLNLNGTVNGCNAETVEDAIVRAPQLLRSQQRAVTESDFEFLAREALPGEVGRVRCLQPKPIEDGRVQDNRVYVMVIPDIRDPRRRLFTTDLDLRQEIIDRIKSYLDARRLLTVHLDVREPTYHGIAINAKLGIQRGHDATQIEKIALDRLYSFINPVIGGYAGTGWEFGRPITRADIFYSLHGIEGVRSVEFLMYQSRIAGPARGPAVNQVDVVKPYGIVASGFHTVEIEYV